MLIMYLAMTYVALFFFLYDMDRDKKRYGNSTPCGGDFLGRHTGFLPIISAMSSGEHKNLSAAPHSTHVAPKPLHARVWEVMLMMFCLRKFSLVND